MLKTKIYRGIKSLKLLITEKNIFNPQTIIRFLFYYQQPKKIFNQPKQHFLSVMHISTPLLLI